jgi:putative ABC transport system permease protein
MVYLRLGLREFRQRPGRAILTLLSIVIGVAAVVAVSLSADTTRRAFDDIFHTVAGRADLEVTAPVGATFNASVVDTIRTIPGVAEASPVIERITVIFVGDRNINLTAMGIDPTRDRAVHEYKIVAGKSLGETKVVLDASFAKNVGLKLGDRFGLLTKRGTINARVGGLFTREGTATTGQGAVLLLLLDDAQYYFKAPKRVDSAQIVLNSDANRDTVRAAIEKALPAGISVDRPASRSSLAEETSLSTELGMQMARGFSLLVAIFIIANTFLINVTQRRKQLGILRAIGATRLQIGTMIYSEAILMGIVGSIVGCLVGIGAAELLTRAMGTLYQTTLPGIHLTPKPFVLAGVFGMGVSFLGAALPARRARQLSPMEALRDVLPSEIEGFSSWLMMLGTSIVAVAGLALAASILGYLPIMHSVWSAILLLIGLMLLLPLVLSPLSAVVSTAVRPFMRIESGIARRQLLRNYSRTTLTIMVVFIAVSTGIGLANSVLDNVHDVRQWYNKAFVADFLLRAMAPELATGLAADLPDGIGEKVALVPGIDSYEAIRLLRARVDGEQVIVVARDFTPHSVEAFDIVSGEQKTLLKNLEQGEVMIGSVLAKRLGVTVGGKVPLGVGEAAHDFTVAAVANDYQAGGLVIYILRSVAQRELGVEGISAYAISVDHKRMAEVRPALEKIAKENGLLLQTNTDIQHKIDGMMAGVVGALWGMVVLGLLVAAFGVANTLTMNVLEQTRELGLLRIIAMTRDQVRKTVFAQALMMGLLALLPGIIAGLAVAYLINLATYPMTGHPVVFVFHPLLVAGTLAAGLVVVAAAAWFPAERAARLRLTEALRYT